MEEGPDPSETTGEKPDETFRMKLSELIPHLKTLKTDIPVDVDQLRSISHDLVIQAMVVEESIKQDLPLPILIKAVEDLKFMMSGITGATSVLFLTCVFPGMPPRDSEVNPTLDPLQAEPPNPS